MDLSISLLKTKNEYVATCPELEVNCYGSNKNQAINRIKNVLQFYLNSAKELGIELDKLDRIIIEGHASSSIYSGNYINSSPSLN